jgi:hypothetical protein
LPEKNAKLVSVKAHIGTANVMPKPQHAKLVSAKAHVCAANVMPKPQPHLHGAVR